MDWTVNGILSVTGDVSLTGASVLRSAPGYAGGVELILPGRTLSVGASAAIDVSGRGNLPDANVTGRSGGSYGGRREDWLGSSNPTYGAVRIVAAQVMLDGQILTNGENGPFRTGGGSGSGAGGGGRIAIYYDDAGGFTNLIDSAKSTGGSTDGGAGTVYIKDNGATVGAGDEQAPTEMGTGGTSQLGTFTRGGGVIYIEVDQFVGGWRYCFLWREPVHSAPAAAAAGRSGSIPASSAAPGRSAPTAATKATAGPVPVAAVESPDVYAISFTVDTTPPVAVIDGPALIDETAATAGVWSVAFSASNSTDNFGIAHYAWDFFNGLTDEGVVGNAAYDDAGVYVVTLVVTDPCTC